MVACARCGWFAVFVAFLGVVWISEVKCGATRRLLVDTDVDTDDFFAILYLLKLNRSEFDLQGITINANAWTNAGHAVIQIYDILYMMGRDDIAVGVGGEGGILEDGTILHNVGGYVPLIEQGMSTTGGCRYKQSIPVGLGGKLDIDTNFGIRKAFLPQGIRRYSPFRQPTAQQVLFDQIARGPVTIIVIGTHTNLAIFLMSNPHLKKNIEHIYVMGGGVRSKNPTGCCPKNDSTCVPAQCGDVGNMFTTYKSNPYAEFNMFGDPFAAYQSYFMWDSFTAGVAVSIMSHGHNNSNGENEFAAMEFMNVTVVTSNEPYGISDGSNPFFDGRSVPKFNLQKNGVHSGHVQRGIDDPFCIRKDGKGICQDGYTKETTGPEAVQVLVATKSKPSKDTNSSLTREYYRHFLEVLNQPLNTGRFNFTTQFPYYNASVNMPDNVNKKTGKPIVFDMDMSAGDFIALFYLLKVPVEEINLKAIFISPTGWANAATIDLVYDLLHMMGRDDIPVGLGDFFAVNQSTLCERDKAIPQGAGGLLDSDTLYGLARDLPRSPRRYTAENSVKFGAPRDTDHPELRQPLVLEVWDSVLQSLDPESKITILTNGPLTSLAKIIGMRQNTTDLIQEVYIVGGHIRDRDTDRGNIFSLPMNKYSEMNIFLDPLAAQRVFSSGLNITLVPLNAQRIVSSFPEMLKSLHLKNKTPEATLSRRLMSVLGRLQLKHRRYKHMETFLGEISGAVLLTGDISGLNLTMQSKHVKVVAKGDSETENGKMAIDVKEGKNVSILKDLNPMAYYDLFTERMNNKKQSAVIASFDEQRRRWSKPPTR